MVANVPEDSNTGGLDNIAEAKARIMRRLARREAKRHKPSHKPTERPVDISFNRAARWLRNHKRSDGFPPRHIQEMIRQVKPHLTKEIQEFMAR